MRRCERVGVDRPLAIMKNHVSRADYQRCVAARGCKPIAAHTPANGDTIPAVGVSWYDAVAYATWLSNETGHHYRLPTDAEWVYAAAELFYDGTVVEQEGDAANPAKRWIATYESLAASQVPVDARPQQFGTYGINQNGLSDVAGNVWDWTSTCFVRHASSNGRSVETESCGVRVVEGAHRTYLTDFVRDPRGGACSVGIPPSNLGIRLVRDDAHGVAGRLVGFLRRLAAIGA